MKQIMHCDVCAAKTALNWGGAHKVLCRACYEKKPSAGAHPPLRELNWMTPVYVQKDGGENGPYSPQQVLNIWRNGGLTMDDFVRIADQKEPKKLRALLKKDDDLPAWMIRRSRGIYILLGILGGFFGLHNFYAGHWEAGSIQLAITLLIGGSFALGYTEAGIGIGITVNFIWILANMIFTKTDGNDQRFLVT